MPVDPRVSILSASLYSKMVAVDICTFLTEEDFTDGQRPMYRAVRECLSREGIVEPSGVAGVLERSGIPEPYKYLLPYLDDNGDQTRHLLIDASGRRIVMEHIRSQRVRKDLVEMVAEARYSEIPIYLSSLESGAKKADGVITDGKITKFLRMMKEHAAKTTLGFPTGLARLDEITGGMTHGQVWAVGAPTSTGKTTLLCQMTTEAIKAGAACLFFSLEMALPLMYARLAGAWCGINPTRIYRGRVSDEETSLIQGSLENFRECGLRVYRDISAAEDIVRCVQEAKTGKGKVDIVAVDFMQNMTAPGDNMLQRMAEGARIMQSLSGEVNCCILIASQLSNEGVRDKGGGIFSYRYASELAHAADVGIELVPSTGTPIDLYVRKNRHGVTGKIEVKFNHHFSAFEDIMPRPTASPERSWGNH